MSKHTDKNADAPETSGDYGKFNTAGDLLAAYNALESEFTKKCQSLKRLQAQLDLLNAQADPSSPDHAVGAEIGQSSAEEERIACGGGVCPVGESVAPVAEEGIAQGGEDVFAADAPRTDRVVGAVAVEADDRAGELTARMVLETVAQNAAEFAETLAALPEIMDACIARYKQKLIGGRLGGVSPNVGMAVIAPTKRPRSLYEAKLLADELLGGL